MVGGWGGQKGTIAGTQCGKDRWDAVLGCR